MPLKTYLIKICGLTRPEDVAAAAALGADLVGFIFHPESPRYAPPKKVGLMESPGALRVGVFVRQSAEEILDIMEKARLDLAQLHGGQSAECCRALGVEKIIKVFWPQKYASREDFQKDLASFSAEAEYYLLDAGMSGGGGGGKFDWKLLENVSFPRKYLLAGGLTPEDLPQLVEKSFPELLGFDFNSGVEEAPGRKSVQALSRIYRNLQQSGVL